MSDNRVSSDIEVWFLLPLRIFGKGFPLMISRRFVVCISSLLLTFTLGCQHSQCVSSNSCRSGGCLPIGGSCMSGWMKQKMGSCNARKRCHRSECGGGDYGCNSCGMTSGGDMNYGGDMMNPDNIYGAASFGGSPGGCGCGQPSGGGYSGTPLPIQTSRLSQFLNRAVPRLLLRTAAHRFPTVSRDSRRWCLLKSSIVFLAQRSPVWVPLLRFQAWSIPQLRNSH